MPRLYKSRLFNQTAIKTPRTRRRRQNEEREEQHNDPKGTFYAQFQFNRLSRYFIHNLVLHYRALANNLLLFFARGKLNFTVTRMDYYNFFIAKSEVD